MRVQPLKKEASFLSGAAVRWNTIYRPRRWALRILQESQAPEFIPCRNGEFSGNIIAFRSDELAEAVNIGPRTAPGTFRFAGNFWFCLDRPERSRPRLPAEETGGTYGQDPLFKDAEKGERRRKHIRGNTYSAEIAQVNAKVTAAGATPPDQLFPKTEKEKK